MRDYSQWGEQKIILEFFGGRAGRFLDLGAFDGVEISNTRALMELGWKGLCVEACPEVFVRLLDNCRQFPNVRCLCAALMDRRGIVPFWHHPGGLATCSPEHAASPGMQGHLRQVYDVAAIAPADLAGHVYDFVSIDIEDAESDVVPVLKPVLDGTQLVCFEANKPGQEAELTAWFQRFGFSEYARTLDEKGGVANILMARN